MSLKFAYHSKTKKIVECGSQSHALSIKTGYDNWVRVIFFPERNRLYFRFFQPSGDFYFISEEDKARSFDVCCDAKDELLRRGVVPKKTKFLFWTTDKEVSTFDIQ